MLGCYKWPVHKGLSMKRYLVFAAVGPLLGGFWLLLTTTLMSGYWSKPPNAAEVTKLLTVFATTLQYSYLFGILPALMIGAVDDILSHVKRIGAVLRVLLVGAIAFTLAELMYGSRGSDSGALQFVMYGLVGFIPGTVSSWLVHKFVDAQVVAQSEQPASEEPPAQPAA
jgi:uncharacterized membrane protein YeaQ/YmgE (transglycosylase-associated protein family)